jgi:hypothetical protein
MPGLLVALAAIYLGAFGPRFWWRGATVLVAVMIAAGVVATYQAANDAHAAGLHFAITPASIAIGLGGQTLFAMAFYGMALLCWWSYRGLTKPDTERSVGE